MRLYVRKGKQANERERETSNSDTIENLLRQKQNVLNVNSWAIISFKFFFSLPNTECAHTHTHTHIPEGNSGSEWITHRNKTHDKKISNEKIKNQKWEKKTNKMCELER